MRPPLCLVAGLLLAILAGFGPATAPPAVAPPPREVVATPPRRPIEYLAGVVTAVDAGSITVRGFPIVELSGPTRGGANLTGSVRWHAGNLIRVGFPDRDLTCIRVEITPATLTLTHLNGDVEVLYRAAQPARRFPVDPVLAAGGFDRRELPGFTYRPADVRVGDEVSIRCRPVGDEDVCRAICIRRRPGGRVPVAPGQQPEDRDPYHEGAQAYQDYEELGVPLPERYDPAAIARAGQVMEAERRARHRTAPPPREAKPKPPAP